MKRNISKVLTCAAFSVLSVNSLYAQWSGSTSSTLISDVNINTMQFRPSSGSGFTIKGNNSYGLGIHATDGTFSGGTSGPGLYMMGHAGSPADMVRFIIPGTNYLDHPTNNIPNDDIAFDILQYNNPTGSFAYYNPSLTIKKSGRVGINAYHFNDHLTVGGNIGFDNEGVTPAVRAIYGHAPQGSLSLYAEDGGNSGAGITVTGNSNTGTEGMIRFVSGGGASNARAFDILQRDNGWAPSMTVLKNGKVVIGSWLIANITSTPTSSPDGFKLFVEQGILTEKIKVAVKNTNDWSDYVFANSYKLKSLHELEIFISDNQHLPDVPSAKEVVENGLDLAKMDAKLLQKIEELTLYVIQQQKEIEQLKEVLTNK